MASFCFCGEQPRLCLSTQPPLNQVNSLHNVNVANMWGFAQLKIGI